MAWLVLVVAGLLEAVWATALSRSDGLTRLIPSVLFVVALAMSMLGLAVALRTLPTGTSYAVWVGIGAVGTATCAVISGDESLSPLRAALLLGLVLCVFGLKLAD